MTAYPEDLDFESASALVRSDVRMLSELCGSPPRRLRSTEPDRSFFRVLLMMLRSEESLSRGEIIARIARLPRNWENAMNEPLMGSAPFHTSEYDLGLKVTVANVGKTPVSAVISTRKNYAINAETGDDVLSLYDIEKIRGEINPGQEMTFPVREAARLVTSLSYMAVKPGISRTAVVSRDRMCLREVAYRAEYSDPDSANRWDKIVLDSREWQAEQAARAFDLATRMMSGKSKDPTRAAEAIADIRSWYPKPDGWDQLEVQLKKAA